MQETAAIIQQRLSEFKPSLCEIIDESHHHVGHKGNTGGGHFRVRIQAEVFQGMPRVAAHRLIYAKFIDLIPHEIHALAIELIDRS